MQILLQESPCPSVRKFSKTALARVAGRPDNSMCFATASTDVLTAGAAGQHRLKTHEGGQHGGNNAYAITLQRIVQMT